MHGTDDFFQVTKAMHNGLQGMPFPWNAGMWDTWLHQNQTNADLFDEAYDVAIIHDPQPAALCQMVRERDGAGARHWVWRCTSISPMRSPKSGVTCIRLWNATTPPFSRSKTM